MAPSVSLSWNYFPLDDIEITAGLAAPQVRLLCAEDEGGSQFLVHCDGLALDALLPYAELLHSWKEDPSSVEKPVIPVYLASGRYHFCVKLACCDYPHLENPTGWHNFSRHYAQHLRFVSLIQKAAKTPTTTEPPTALACFLKKST